MMVSSSSMHAVDSAWAPGPRLELTPAGPNHLASYMLQQSCRRSAHGPPRPPTRAPAAGAAYSHQSRPQCGLASSPPPESSSPHPSATVTALTSSRCRPAGLSVATPIYGRLLPGRPPQAQQPGGKPVPLAHQVCDDCPSARVLPAHCNCSNQAPPGPQAPMGNLSNPQSPQAPSTSPFTPWTQCAC